MSLPSSRPLSVHHSGGNGGGRRSSRSALSASSFQPAQPRWLPSEGDSFPSASLSPLQRAYTPETLLPLWLLFIISGSGRPRTLGSRPRGWGRRDPGSAAGSLAPGSVWVRRPKPYRAGAGEDGRQGGRRPGRERRELALPWLPQSAPHPESHRIPSPYSSSQPCLRPTDILGVP